MGSKSAMEGLVLFLVATSVQVLVVAGRRPPALYVFGDSILDVGNNNYLPGEDVPRANRPYYGVDFPGMIPTGRFSNGCNTADYVGAYTYFYLAGCIFRRSWKPKVCASCSKEHGVRE
jgi:hypothetical protein